MLLLQTSNNNNGWYQYHAGIFGEVTSTHYPCNSKFQSEVQGNWNLVFQLTISIRLEDSIYEELGAMLDAMGQTKQTFYETFTRTALRERSIPFIIKAPIESKSIDTDAKMAAFLELKAMRKNITEDIDSEREREEAMNEKYGIVD